MECAEAYAAAGPRNRICFSAGPEFEKNDAEQYRTNSTASALC